MATFPGGIWSIPERGTNMSDATTQTDILDSQNEEILAIEQTLGTNPQGSLATVKARLERLEWMATPAVCQLVQASAQTVAYNTPTTVTFGVEDLDPRGWHSTSSNTDRVTPDIAGWYRVTFLAEWSTDTDYTRLLVDVQKNGALVGTPRMGWDLRAASAAGLSPVDMMASSPLISMNGTTDYISLGAYQTNASSGSATVQCRLLVELVYASL